MDQNIEVGNNPAKEHLLSKRSIKIIKSVFKILISILVVILYFNLSIRHSYIFRNSLERVRSHKLIRVKLGEPIKGGYSFKSSYGGISGKLYRKLTYVVRGSKNSAIVTVKSNRQARKKSEFLELTVSIDGAKISLLEDKNIK